MRRIVLALLCSLLVVCFFTLQTNTVKAASTGTVKITVQIRKPAGINNLETNHTSTGAMLSVSLLALGYSLNYTTLRGFLALASIRGIVKLQKIHPPHGTVY